MKLTCTVIIAVLFLTACQLTTADDSRGRQEYPTKRLRANMPNSKLFKLTKRCTAPGGGCTRWTSNCCSNLCILKKDGNPVCRDS
uniref:Conotoxin n=1 Tax=Conus betulinus TaxID=89764 RepID=A0A142C1L1_CONBE|nr:conotoxin [Conus betulinus]